VAGVTESVHKNRTATARKRRVSDSLSSPNPSSDLHLEFCDLFCRIGQVLAGSVQSASIIFHAMVGFIPRNVRAKSAAGGQGAVAQLGERLICIQEVAGSIPTSSTRFDSGL
jgi:hypothetical protein